jgi:hypothetical protein
MIIYVLVKYYYDYYEFCDVLAAGLDRAKLEALVDKDDYPLFNKERHDRCIMYDGSTHYFIHEFKDGVKM